MWEDADTLFVGFWTDKGSCSEEMKNFLHGLNNKKIFLFGTAGFGGNETYFAQILNKVSSEIGEDNQIIGTYMCQGRMPESVKMRYQKMLEAKPEEEQIKKMLENYEQALSHPDEKDLKSLKEKVNCIEP